MPEQERLERFTVAKTAGITDCGNHRRSLPNRSDGSRGGVRFSAVSLAKNQPGNAKKRPGNGDQFRVEILPSSNHISPEESTHFTPLIE